jgi:hypothetical protein
MGNEQSSVDSQTATEVDFPDSPSTYRNMEPSDHDVNLGTNVKSARSMKQAVNTGTWT